MIDLRTVIGIYSITNTGAVLVHSIDYDQDRVLASINGQRPTWCDMMEKDIDGELTLGFVFGAFFIPFDQIMRFTQPV